MPPQLLPFTPRYKGVLYVQLEEEEDGYLKLLGYYPQVNHDNDRSDVSPEVNVERDEDDRFLQAPSQFSSGASTPVSSGSELDMPSAVERSETPSGQPSG
nr:hypothetical protein BaRGS_010947 [Batillaria attramentaria]